MDKIKRTATPSPPPKKKRHRAGTRHKKQSSRNSITSDDSQISNSNASDVLSHSDVPNDTTDNLKKPKPPPIIVDLPYWHITAKTLMPQFPAHQVTAKLTNNVVHLITYEPDSFRAVQSKLSENDIPFHTFTLPTERTLKVVLRGIPPSYEESEVQAELEREGFTAKSIRQFIKDGRKLPIYMISLPCNPENKQIFELTSLFYISIRVEPYRSNGPSQCFHCQGFGHSSTHCGHPPKCVKCGGNHQTSSCTKTPETPPKCANCNGEHTANYRKCPAFIAIAQPKIKVTPRPFQHPPNTPSQITRTPPTPKGNTTFAQVVSQKPNANQPAVTIPTRFLMKILTDTIKEVSESNDLKASLLATLSAIISLINYNHG